MAPGLKDDMKAFMGGIGSIAAMSIAYPFDYIKKR